MMDSSLGLNGDGPLSGINEIDRDSESLESRLEPYPFLRACLEDCDLVRHIIDGRDGNARHAVVLMHDALEFVLYEILLLLGEDIYSDGQHTIGLNNALSLCKKLDVDVPLLGTVRTIQKHRGDAKHHAQVPHDKAFEKMATEFDIIITRLVYEHFGSALDDAITKLHLLPYQAALYDCYRKYRNHNWTLAVRFILGALLHKYRRLFSTKDIYSGIPNELVEQTIGKLASEFRAVDKRKAKELVEFIVAIPDTLIKHSGDGDLRNCAESAAEAYSRMDEMIPPFFRSSDAVFLTPRLAKTDRMRFSGPMGWARSTAGDTKLKESYLNTVTKLLNQRQSLVAELGEPQYEADDDRYWKWWDLAVFDGMRWHTFQMSDSFSISLESMAKGVSDCAQRERVARLILEEFTEASEKRPIRYGSDLPKSKGSAI